jgi:hypothetical protein
MEWQRIDKSTWPVGPWNAEPDKVQWVDEATGLDCLIVRNNGGALCGYVGVPEGHPWHGVDYSGCTQKPPCGESWCEHTPGSAVEVHGGLTFADSCNEPKRERWESWRQAMLTRRDEAKRYPKGDAAREWAELSRFLDDYEGWREYMIGRTICHVPLPGRPDSVWWLGFDCAHSGDFSPGYDSFLNSRGYDVYRDREYVERECRKLAAQLKAAA